MLSREWRYEVSSAALDRWSEPLESSITSVPAENLSALITPDAIIHSVQTPGSNGSLLEANKQLGHVGPKSNTEAMWR